jgi:hypothetical protein
MKVNYTTLFLFLVRLHFVDKTLLSYCLLMKIRSTKNDLLDLSKCSIWRENRVNWIAAHGESKTA